MTEAPKASLQQLLQHWTEERNRLWREQLDTLCQENLQRDLTDSSLLEALAALTPPPPAPPAQDTLEQRLDEAMNTLESAQSQGEVLKRLLEALQSFTERCAIFVIKQGIANLYAARGFDNEAPHYGAPVKPPEDLEALIQGRVPRLENLGLAYAALLAPLSSFEASSVLILPLKLRRKTVAVLLADSGLGATLDYPNTIRVLIRAAESCISSLAGQKDDDRAAAPSVSAATILTQQIADASHETAAPSATLDPKIRANAERSARVLVGDIELYFPAKVEQGRLAGDLYGLLHDELDRSRASFVERYGEEVERQHQIFANTVIQQLCGGDPLKLGIVPWP